MSAPARLVHEQNAAAWNDAAAGYRDRLEAKIRRLAERDAGTLLPIEADQLRALLRPGASAAHLQCADGSDTLSLVKLGFAGVTGIDISGELLDVARDLAAATGLSARWVRSDVLGAAQAAGRRFDVVLASKGVLMWMHDLDAWAATVAALLEPGGRLVLFDLHPVTVLFRPDTPELVPTGRPYFGFTSRSRGWPAEYIGQMGGQRVKTERAWSLGDVLGSVLRAGLRITHFAESDVAYWAAFPQLRPDLRATFPKTFLLTATAP
jgi:2-polyprenyl-3-methyl-5-hydroxy-6-metoxy-1,4-benzoquinol methylase